MTKSIEKLQKKLDKAPNSTIFFQLAEEHRKEGNLEDALRILKEGLSRHPSYWSARVTLGRVYHQIGKAELAREELEKVIQAVPDNLLANKLLGDIYMFMDHPTEALKRYRIVQMLNPSDEEVVTLIKRLESEIRKPGPVPEPPPLPKPFVEVTKPSVERTEPVIADEESYAPTIQMRIPEFLEKTEVPVNTAEATRQEAVAAVEEVKSSATEEEPVLPSVEELESVEESEMASDTLILEHPEIVEEYKAQIQAQQSEEIDQSEELSSLAGLLLAGDSMTVEEHQFDELESELMDDSEFEREEVMVRDAQTDRTQPIDEGEEAEIEDAEELTTETLAELYLSQGLVDKAVKVYQRLLLNDPGNLQILQRLKELSPEVAEEPVYQEEEVLVVQPEQPKGMESAVIEELARRDEARRRKITTLENWLTTIRRERD
ncbi:tetratricopeptide repeat protein [bacterium]|nr:tetratricopeptide repeat protein [bacterium]MCI0606758.1 tetratricopeptide repeat protein [bacterium]